MEVNMLEKFPLLTFWNEKKYWSGFIKVQSKLIRMSLHVPRYPLVEDLILKGDATTCDLILKLNLEDDIRKLIKTPGMTLLCFLEGVQKQLIGSVEKSGCEHGVLGISSKAYVHLFNDLQAVDVEKIQFVTKDCREIHITEIDLTGREHVLKFFVPLGYPDQDLRVESDLPSTNSDPIEFPCTSMSAAYTHFKKILEKFELFWNDMDEFDGAIQILDPPRPSRKHVHRRVRLEQGAILHFEINPSNPRLLPHVKFYGGTDTVEMMENSFTRNCKKWNQGYSVLENLQALLETELPCKILAEVDDCDTKCVICYMYELEHNVPETICECGSFFHNQCLQELYINELSNNVMKTNAVDCPVCTLEIKIPESS